MRSKSSKKGAAARPQKSAKSFPKNPFLCKCDKSEIFFFGNPFGKSCGENSRFCLWKTLWKLRKTRSCKDFCPHFPQKELWKTLLTPSKSSFWEKRRWRKLFFFDFALDKNLPFFAKKVLWNFQKILANFCIKRRFFCSFFQENAPLYRGKAVVQLHNYSLLLPKCGLPHRKRLLFFPN